jgi:hypothetical protein
MRMSDEPEKEALFYIEGPDERGCVWMHGASSTDPWAQNLGPQDKVAAVLSQWLGSIDYDEAEADEWTGQPQLNARKPNPDGTCGWTWPQRRRSRESIISARAAVRKLSNSYAAVAAG